MKKYALTLLLNAFFLIITGCSNLSISEMPNDEKKPSTVVTPKEGEKSDIIVQLDPEIAEKVDVEREKGEDNQLLAVYLSPGLYRSIAHISFLEALDQKEIEIDLITGSGLGAVISALYANGVSPERIEWNFYKFLAEAKEEAPFSRSWMNLVKKELISPLKGKKIEDSKIKLMIPVYDGRERIVEYLAEGDLYEALVANLRIQFNPREDNAFFIWEPLDRYPYELEGVKTFIAVDAFGKNLKFKGGDGFLLGNYSKAQSLFNSSKSSFDYIVKLPTDGIDYDTVENLPSVTQDSFRKSSSTLEILKDDLKSDKNGTK